MPNRIIKESICTSDDIAGLTWFEEVVFYRLMVTCDDYGRYDGRISILKSRMFPLNPNVTEKSLENAINKLSTCGLVMLYKYDSKPYLQLTAWQKHQQIRNKKSKYPAPTEDTIYLPQTPQESAPETPIENTCNQLISNADNCPRNPNPNPNPIKSSSSVHADAREYIKGLFASEFESGSTYNEVSSIIDLLKAAVGEHEFCDDDRYLLDVAFSAANKAGKRNVAYIEGVFNNFKKRNIKTQEDHIRYEDQRAQAAKAKSGSKAKKSKVSMECERSYDLDEFNRRSAEEPLIYKSTGGDEV